tara:strand:+ start:8788 stop:9498 length:711 start_codon:yes stop_codon:yes gene_type:complete
LKYNTYNINGFKIFDIDEKAFLSLIPSNIFFISINSLMVELHKKELSEIVKNNVGYADGIGIVFAIKYYYRQTIPHITGSDIWLKIIKRYPLKKYYLLGSKKYVIEKTVQKLEIDYPGINIVGYRDGYIKKRTIVETIINDLHEKQPDIIFIALGTPYQELVIAELKSKYEATYLGLGGSFDRYCGKLPQPPNLILKCGLEWLWRWFYEPIRRTKKNINLIPFVIKVLSKRYKEVA